MENLRRLAAIDIGSNAVRLLINNVLQNGDIYFKKASLLRVPVRLGEDAFIRGEISEKTTGQLIHAMHAFKHLLTVFDVVDYMGCATSAMREAANGAEVAERIRAETGIDIRIIDGKEEAKIIFSTHLSDSLNPNRTYLFVDVGGGSTETTFFEGHLAVASKSWNVGTVRLLRKQEVADEWESMTKWLRKKSKGYDDRIQIIGSGGNINRVFKISRNKLGKPITYAYLQSLYKLIKGYSIHQRMTILDLNPDRADVIEPAMKIFLHIMATTGARQVLVPKVGLSDGMIRKVYDRFLHRHAL